MPLTYVQKWHDGIGWVDVTIGEAVRAHRYTVSADAHIFRCRLCGDYVTLTAGNINERHFRHEIGPEKDCEERTHSGWTPPPRPSLQKKRVYLKIDDSQANQQQICLKIGLPMLPKTTREQLSGSRLQIISSNAKTRTYNLDDYLLDEGVTYLPSLPLATSYSLNVLPLTTASHLPRLTFAKSDALSRASNESQPESIKRARATDYWPEKIEVFRKLVYKGINAQVVYAVFDAVSKRMLSYDGDVVINRPYYVLADYNLSFLKTKGLSNEFLGCINSKYYLHKITCTEFWQEVYEIIERLGLKLTQKPALLYPIWPPYVNNKATLHHNYSQTFLFMSGNAVFKSFPDDSRDYYDYFRLKNSPFSENRSQIIKVDSKDREQYFTIGRNAEAMEQFVFWRADNTKLVRRKAPTVRIYISREEITDETIIIYTEPPRRFRVESDYNGFVKTEKSGRVVNCVPLKAGERLTIDAPQYGQKFLVCQGLDVVRTIEFIQKKAPPKETKPAPTLEPPVAVTPTTTTPVTPETPETGQEKSEPETIPPITQFTLDISEQEKKEPEPPAPTSIEPKERVQEFGKAPTTVLSQREAPSDFELRKRLEYAKGTSIAIPSRYLALCTKMDDYPLVKAWLVKAVRTRSAPHDAFKIVVNFFGH
ncbi:MAG: hypothetical protein PHO46_05265 [Thermoguttaceae bacterium]|jgi:hypothetical protein|nr:hypothetical protein [Thermoguttaceae bacterium]